jgi:hypothetical protein
MRLKDFRTRNGSRQFAELYKAVSPETICAHLRELSGLEITRELFTPHWDDSLIDFAYRGHTFTMNVHWADCWFFVDDPGLPGRRTRDRRGTHADLRADEVDARGFRKYRRDRTTTRIGRA